MTDRSRRVISRINYQTFNSTGEKVFTMSTQPTTDSHGVDNITMLTTEINVCIDEINDIIDEHSIADALHEDTKEVLAELSSCRKELRMKSSTLSAISPDHHATVEPRISETYDLIKDFIKTAKDHKTKSQLRISQLEEDKFAVN